MSKRFTDDDILRFIYDEMPLSESNAFLDELCLDEALWQQYERLQEISEKVSGLSFEPSESTTQNILQHVADTRPAPIEAVPAAPLKIKVPTARRSLNTALLGVLFLLGSATIGTAVYFGYATQESLQAEQIPASEQILEWEEPMIDEEIQSIRESIDEIRDELSE